MHTEFMLVTPLGADPIVVIGSANFSKASVDTNDENMAVIRGDRELADACLVELMRSYTHHAFREAVATARPNNEEWTAVPGAHGQLARPRLQGRRSTMPPPLLLRRRHSASRPHGHPRRGVRSHVDAVAARRAHLKLSPTSGPDRQRPIL